MRPPRRRSFSATRNTALRARGLAGGFLVARLLRAADRQQRRHEIVRVRKTAVGRRRLGMAGDELLDDAVLERMEADHRQPPARLQARQGGVEPGFEVGQLAVDEDADRLEAARGRDGSCPCRAASPRRSGRPAARCGSAAARRGGPRSCARSGGSASPRRRSTARRRCPSRTPRPATAPRSRRRPDPCACRAGRPCRS